MAKFAHDSILPDDNSVLSKKEQVAVMFDSIAGKYDFLNRALSLGIDQRWRKQALKQLAGIKPQRVLDVATGTADLAIMASRLLKPVSITGIDISEGMLAIGREKVQQAGLQGSVNLLKGDSETINFEAGSFDAVTVAFGVRNFQNLEKGLDEIKRVLKPGGRLVVLEFSKPKLPFFLKPFYGLYMKVICPGMGKLFSKNKTAYKYLDKSIEHFPEGKDFINVLQNLGYNNIYEKKLSLGICTIYVGEK